MRRLLIAVALALPFAAVVGCQPAQQPQPFIRVCCPQCRGVHSDKCPWCHGRPYEPDRWGR